MKKTSNVTFWLPWFICSLGALFYSYEYFLRIAPSVMTNDLVRFFHINEGQLGSLSGFYYYIYTPMQLVAGVLMDRYGPRLLLTMASLSCVIGSFLFAATNQLWVAEVGRFLIGFGSAFAFVGVLKLATIWLPSRYFAMFSGLATALGMLGAIAGNLVLTNLVNMIGWQNTIYLSGAFGILVALLIGLFVKEQDLDRKKASNAIDIQHVIYNLWTIMKSTQMWIVGTIGGLLYVATSAFAELWGNPYLQAAHHLNPAQAAIAISFIFAGWVVGGPLAGWISDTIKRRNLPLTISALIAAVLIGVVLFMPHLTRFEIYSLLFIFGVFSGAEVTTFAIGREISSPEAAGSAIAFTNMVVMLSGVIFQPFIGHFLDFLWNGQMLNKVPLFTTFDYQVALSVIPIGLVICAFMSHFLLKETYCVSTETISDKARAVPGLINDLSFGARIRQKLYQNS